MVFEFCVLSAAICLPECQNNGICVAPGQCNCPENFSGPQCQFENKPCLNYPPMPQNSRRLCRATLVVVFLIFRMPKLQGNLFLQ